jgi:hypothetical protein
MARIGGYVQWRAISFGLFRRQPFIIDAVEPVGINVPLKALHVMHIMREHHHTALRIHDVVIELLT